MKLSITKLERAEIGTVLPLDQQTPQLTEPDLTFEQVGVTGSVTVLENGLLVAGTVSAVITTECSRCLITFPHQIKAEFSELVVQNPELDQFGHDGKTLDLRPIVRTVALLALPIRPLHDPACQGLCPECGKDLNEQPHDHPSPKVDSPFANLKKPRK